MTFFSKDFSFEEMTRTDHVDLLQANRRAAWLYVFNLRSLAREQLQSVFQQRAPW